MSRNHKKKKSSKSNRSRSQSLISEYFNCSDENNAEEKKFEIKISKTMGRYMVSTRDLKPGEAILSEDPMVIGPCVGCKVQCLGCYVVMDEKSLKKCINCKWPLCSETCSGNFQKYGHTDLECSILKECQSSKFLNYNDLKDIRLNLHTIVPLRCLILKTTDPSLFDAIMDMESHNEIRKNIPELWNNNQTQVVDKIIKNWGLTEFTSQEIHTICGILEVNAFEIGHQGVTIRGLYPSAFLMSHNCVPNTNHIDDESYRLTVRASTRVDAGEPITLSYAYTLQSTLRRREHLLENKFFECCCQRCSDPSELDCYTGALICPKCRTGFVLADNPLQTETTWSCVNGKNKKNCSGYSITARSMSLLINRISEEIEFLDCNDIKGLESLLEKYRNVLHPNHYLCLGVKLSLSQLYGKINGYIIHDLSENLLVRKVSICKDILRIFDIIEPGFTRIRGVTLYELHAPLMILLTRAFEKKTIARSDIKVKLKEVIRCLAEASIILGNEPNSSAEGKMGVAAKQALLQIKDWEKVVGKI